MKTILYSGAVVAALCLLTSARADVTSPRSEDPLAAMSADYAAAQRAAADVSASARDVAEQARAVATQQRIVIAQASQDANSFDMRLRKIQPTIQSDVDFNFIPSHADRGLVICSSGADPKILAEGQEDLTIMGRILEKAFYQVSGDEARQAMGIRIFAFGNSEAPRNLLIQGYGAVFMLNVNFPLAGTMENTNAADTKVRTNSPWDETKHELYGGPSAEGNVSGVRQEYDGARVESLKKILITALKNASNIRNLKSDESVTLVVTSEGGRSPGHAVARYEQKLSRIGGGGSAGNSGGGGGSGASWKATSLVDGSAGSMTSQANSPMLTIRAKKSDIDAFAKDKMNFEEFRNKTAVLLY
jgi:hypothetical protein